MMDCPRSVHERAMNDCFLTNNNAEVFHGNYKTHLNQTSHPSILTFVEGLKADSEVVMVDRTFWHDSVEQARSRDDSGATT